MIAGKRRGNPDMWWAIHNLIAHPLSEVLYWIGFMRLGNKLHDATIPIHDTDKDGRG